MALCYQIWYNCTMRTLPVVALVGRPNVGKSTLFNRLIGRRQAVVSDIAGTTRDRLEQVILWNERQFAIVDMAGLEPALKEKTEIRQGMQEQVEKALNEADIILWIVDGQEGVTTADTVVAELLRRLHRQVIVVANKCDNMQEKGAEYEFSRFGFGETLRVSAIHGTGREALLTSIVEALPEKSRRESLPLYDERELRIALAGRPNVGKSTLLNALVGDSRAVVSAEAGTTRDSVDTLIRADSIFGDTYTRWKTVRIVDTAGIRSRGKIDRSIEGWSVLRTFVAIEDAEIVLLVLDAVEGMVHQDLQVAERIVDSGRPLILLMNKWDAVLAAKDIIPGTPEDQEQQEKVLSVLRFKLPFMPWVQVLFLSGEKGINLDVVGKVLLNAHLAWSKEPKQEEIDVLADHLRTNPRLNNLQKISFEHAQPPVFHVHIHGRVLPHFSTRRYIENALRDYFDIGPTPIKIWVQLNGPEKKKK
jgi:GTP-binding protein